MLSEVAVQVASLFGVLRMQDSEFRASAQNARSEMIGLGERMDSLGQSVTNLGTNMTMITAPLAAFGIAGVSVAANFDSAMAEISARTGLVGADLEQVRNVALKMGADTAFSAQQAADAFLQLLSSGQSAEEAIATLPAVLDAAAASGEDLGKTADTVTDIMAMFGLGVEDASLVVNTLAKAAGASSADMASLGQGFSNVGGVAKNFGLTVEDTAAVLAIFAENGIKGAEAGTNLKSMLLQMSRPVEEVGAAWEKLGTSLYDANGNARPLEQVIQELDRALDALPVEEQNTLMQTLGGSYGIVGLNALRGSISIGDMRQRMNEQASAAEIAQKRMETFNGRIDSLRGSVETLMISAMTPLMETVLTPLVLKLTDVVNSVTDWINANPELAQQIVRVMTVVVGLGPALMIAGKAISIVGGLLTVLTSPLGLIVAAVGALGLAWKTNFLGIRDTFQPIVDNIVGGFRTLFGVLGNLGNIISTEGIGSAIDYIINAFAQMFGFVEDDSFFEPLRGIGDKIMTLLLNAVSAIQGFGDTLGKLWADVGPSLENLAAWFINDALPAIVDFVINIAIPAVGDFIKKLGEIWADVGPALGDLATWFITEGLPGIVDFVNDTAIPAIQEFGDWLGAIWEDVGPELGKLATWFVTEGLPGIVSFITTTAIPAFKDFIEKTLIPIIQNTVGWIEKNPALATSILMIVAASLILIPILSPILTLFGAIGTAITVARTAAGLLSGAMMGAIGPIIAVGLAVAGVIAQIHEFNKLTGTAASSANKALAPKLESGQITQQQLLDQAFKSTAGEFGGGLFGDIMARLLHQDIAKGVQTGTFQLGTGGSGIGLGMQSASSGGGVLQNPGSLFGGGGGGGQMSGQGSGMVSNFSPGSVVIQANSYAEGQAAADGFEDRMKQLYEGRGN